MTKEKTNKIRFGTGGIPFTAVKRDTVSGIQRIAELGLAHLELEFVYSVYLKEAQALEVKGAANQNDVTLTIHGSYFTNFAAVDPQKWHASIDRLIKAAGTGEMAGAKSITFHSAFFTGQSEEKVRGMVVLALKEVFKKLNDTEIILAPELTGKRSQFGSLDELINLVKDMQDSGFGHRVKFCIDFAHNHARNNGIFTTTDEYKSFFDKIAEELGEEYLQGLHMHMSAIEYSEKGERNHLTLLESLAAYKDSGVVVEGIDEHFAELVAKGKAGGGKQDWRELLKVLKSRGVSGYMVCESPILELDALLFSRTYDSL